MDVEGTSNEIQLEQQYDKINNMKASLYFESISHNKRTFSYPLDMSFENFFFLYEYDCITAMNFVKWQGSKIV